MKLVMKNNWRTIPMMLKLLDRSWRQEDFFIKSSLSVIIFLDITEARENKLLGRVIGIQNNRENRTDCLVK
ncbi:hypothetical protein SDJN02_19184, partial [Cucurbita argyrosperma subsp. argyrosperma]